MSPSPLHSCHIAFIGGGNMASAILGGLIRQGMPRQQLTVIEPFDAARTRLQHELSITALPEATAILTSADVVVWAVKPQQFYAATLPVVAHTANALHVSVAAGITTDTLSRWLGTVRVVRAMPNTPALVGQGITGLFATPAISANDQALVDALLAPTGQRMWLENESQIDALMTISGSGPAYVFYWIEALIRGGMELGLSAAQSRQLAAQTFAGAAALLQASDEPPEVLRQRVTSKGGTTHEAISVMQTHAVDDAIVKAQHACYNKGLELSQQFS